MLPCRVDATKKDQGGAGRRKLLSNDENVMWRRVLAGSGGDDFCTKNVRFWSKNLTSTTYGYGLYYDIWVKAALKKNKLWLAQCFCEE